MATYKVIQDIEAEDKLVGPLTLRQFIYAGVSAVCMYICFLAFTKHVEFLIIFFLPIACVSGFFAFPWRGEQPTEIWALARLRFALKPRVRIWDQDGAKDLVTITAPKKLATMQPVRNLSQSEVQSRLKALADTIDSRGWATRNAAYAPYGQNWIHQSLAPVPNSSGLAVSMPDSDIFDSSNSVAQNFDALLTRSADQKLERVKRKISQAQNPQAEPEPQPLPQQQPQQYAQTAYQPVAPQGYATMAPSLPSPIMPAAYQPQAYQPPQLQMPPQFGQPQGVDLQQLLAPPPNLMQANGQPNSMWFANGPAYPASPLPPAAASQAAAMMTPQFVPPPVPPPINVEARHDEASFAPHEAKEAGHEAPANPVAPQDSRIESDVPLPGAATPTAEDAAMAAEIKERNSLMTVNYNHLKVLQPVSDYPSPADDQDDPLVSTIEPAKHSPHKHGHGHKSGTAGQAAATPHDDDTQKPALTPAQPVTPQPDPAILKLANNDDLDIATLARQAKKEIQKAPDEVEIRLH